MRYLRKYDFFKEVLNISTTDRPDEKLAKQSANDVEADLKEFGQKKTLIDQVYNSTKNSLEIEQQLKTILPEEENKNQFLVDWLRICRIQNEIEETNRKRVLADDNKSTLTGEKDLKELNDKIMNFDKMLADKSKELQKLKVDHKKLIDDTTKELKKDTQEIQSKK
jgi:hypothetical protein